MKRKTKFGRVIFALSLGCATALSCAALGQASAEPPVQLTNFEYTSSGALAGRVISLTQMGANGYFYAQVTGGYRIPASIQRVSLDGNDVRSYSLNRIVRPMYLSGRSPYIESVMEGKDGSLDVLADWDKGRLPEIHTMVVFNADGSVSSIIPIHLKKDPQIMHFAPFGDGRYLLLAGYWGSHGYDPVDVVLMNSEGKVLRKETLPRLSSARKKHAGRHLQHHIGRRKAQKKAQQGAASGSASSSVPASDSGAVKKEKEKAAEKRAAEKSNYAMSALFSDTVLIQGDDGNVYMVRPDRLHTLYQVTDSGDITPIPLSKGRQGKVAGNRDTLLMSGSVRNGELMLCYARFNRPVYSTKPRTLQSLEIRIYDLESHQLIATYTGAKSRLSPLLVGWDGNAFYFLRYVKKGQHSGYEIEKATP